MHQIAYQITFLCGKSMTFFTSRKYVNCGIKVNLKTLMSYEKHKQINNAAMKISAVLECNSTNSSSVDTNLQSWSQYFETLQYFSTDTIHHK